MVATTGRSEAAAAAAHLLGSNKLVKTFGESWADPDRVLSGHFQVWTHFTADPSSLNVLDFFYYVQISIKYFSYSLIILLFDFD